MSVYTSVDTAQLKQFLQRYELGHVRAFEPIAAGITNTNYSLETEDGAFVLTLYEQHSDDELDYMLGLQQHLADRGVRCAAPLKDRRGAYYSILRQRPAAIIHRLPGSVEKQPGASHSALIGAELARFHLEGADFSGHRPNPRGIDWVIAVADMLENELDSDKRQLLENTLADYARFDIERLPSGAIHADLFHDNALFVDDQLGGVFDFDYACQDSFVFDIAVTLNDWCVDDAGELDPALGGSLLTAYCAIRQLERLELEALPLMLRFAALRFWLSRLHDRAFPKSGELTFIKNPDEFRKMLELRTGSQRDLLALFLPHDVG